MHSTGPESRPYGLVYDFVLAPIGVWRLDLRDSTAPSVEHYHDAPPDDPKGTHISFMALSAQVEISLEC